MFEDELSLFFGYEKKTKQRLLKSLLSLSESLNIPVYYENDLGDAGGMFVYHHINGKLNFDKKHIKILNKWKDDPYILAHELGHYFDLMKNGDSTENRADEEAYKLCCIILQEREQKYLKIGLGCHFDKPELYK